MRNNTKYVASVYIEALNLMEKLEGPENWAMLKNALAPTYYSVKDTEHFIDETAYRYGTKFAEEYERRDAE